MIEIDGSGMRVTLAVGDKTGADPNGKRTTEEIARMSHAERLDYCRQFNQKKMPEWTNPRGGSAIRK
jgi:hypothetical protein